MATGTYAPWPFEQCFDNNGNPLNGGKLFTYLAGTSTPASTYSDVNLTTPNANPIVLSSAGFPSSGAIFLTTGVSYKFVLQDAGGSTIATRDNVLAVPGTSNPTTDIHTVDLRLTLTSGTPVTTADVTAAPTIFIEPYKGNRIALYDGSTWNMRTVTASSFSVPATTSTLYDVFVYDSSGTPTYETLAWTNDTTRATALTTQDGVLVKTGAVTRRYLGSFRTTTVSGQTEDSNAKRYVWNYYNRAKRRLRVVEGTASWNYTTATYHQANAAPANQVDAVIGVQEGVPVSLQVSALVLNTTGSVAVGIAIGLDSTTVADTGNLIAGAMTVSTTATPLHTRYEAYPSAGRHFFVWLEISAAVGTTTWQSNGAIIAGVVAGIEGWTEG
jgi:hypothetical protein